VGTPVLEHVQLFTLGDDGQWLAMPEQGADIPFAARAIPNRSFVFPLHLPPGKTTSMLLRVSDTGAAVIKATLWQPVEFQASELVSYEFLCLYFGSLAGMLLYNLLLYVVVRDRRFMLYVGFVGCLGIGLLGNTGLGAQYLWGGMTWWNTHTYPLGYAGAIFFSTLLTRHFFSTRQRLPRCDKALTALTWLAAGAVAATLLLPKLAAVALIIPAGIVVATLTPIISVLAVIRRWPGAAYYCAASLSVHTGTLIGLTRLLFLVPKDISLAQALAFGSCLEMVLLSLALADRINEERRLKQRAQSQTLGILEASQALSSVTRLDRLHARIGEVMARVTGATTTQLVLWDAELKRWFLYGAGPDAGRVSAEDAGSRGLMSYFAFDHVRQSGAPLIVDDAVADPRFAGDPAFAGASCCSLCALRISHQGAALAVMILECRNRRGAFSNVALSAVEAIAGPLAVYLENALLYERLEQRVTEQTRELRGTQQELLATAKRAGMAEMAANVLHNVGNTLNSVNVAAELMRGELARSRGAALGRVVDLLDAHAQDLGDFMSNDEKGRRLPGYLRELTEALGAERADMQDHLDRLTASVEHIKNVIAMQQAHAARSVAGEPVRPIELIDEALRITDDVLQEGKVRVVKQLAEVPPVRLDKTRTVQILVNLVTNAKQAMDHGLAPRRTLTLRLDAADGKLRIQVKDCGVGIAAENMNKLFSHGFTTRRDGHGFGLHSCALAASEMGGRLAAHSDGTGFGATFTLELPLEPA
jgi:signal transduction histidine kinase